MNNYEHGHQYIDMGYQCVTPGEQHRDGRRKKVRYACIGFVVGFVTMLLILWIGAAAVRLAAQAL